MRDRAATRALVLGLLALPFAVFAPFAIWSGARSWRRTGAAAGLIAGVIGLATFVIWTTYWLIAS
jgi:hypothetical protein